MNRKLLNIVKSSPVLSREELVQYVHGDLTETECYQIELKLTNNPINQELLDAYIENPTALKGRRCILRQWFNQRIFWFFVGFALLLVGLFLFEPDFLKSDVVSDAEKPVERGHEPATNIPTEAILETGAAEEIESQTPVTHAIQVSAKQTIEYSTVVPIPKRTATAIEHAEIASPKPVVNKKYPAIYLGDFKVTDYGKIRVVEKKETLDLSGRPASEMSGENTLEYERLENDSTFYVDFLRETLRGFKHEQYGAILPAWQTILKTFPDDDNALFYGALTKFKLEQYRASIKDLQAVLANPMTNFEEEANWYLALNYYSSGDLKQCKQMLESIIEDATFYKEKALILIEQCK